MHQEEGSSTSNAINRVVFECLNRMFRSIAMVDVGWDELQIVIVGLNEVAQTNRSFVV